MPIRTVGHFPDAVQRDNGAPLIRDRHKRRVSNDPGSAAHHHDARKTRVNALSVLRRARDVC
jgi:limonene-1,2-epoxide hydrolase